MSLTLPHRRGRNPNHASAAAVALVALAGFAGTYWFDPVPPGLPGLGAVEFPRLICLVLLALAGLLALKQSDPPSEEDAPRITAHAWAVFGLCALFLPAMEVAGMLGASALFLVAAGRIWGERRWPLLLLSAAGVTAALWLVFVQAFRLKLPLGWLGS